VTLARLPRIEAPDGHEVHHEVEIGAVIGRGGRDIGEDAALSHVAGLCVALDLTSRTEQAAAKERGMPWSFAKGRDTFCPISPVIPGLDAARL
jgi:acylpyruvate hydrolase